jgi:regulator of replication initiation timing
MTSKPLIEDYAGLVGFNEALLEWLLDERERKGKVSRERRIEALLRENADLQLENSELKRQLSAAQNLSLSLDLLKR